MGNAFNIDYPSLKRRIARNNTPKTDNVSYQNVGTGFSVPRAFKFDHLPQIKPILFPQFFLLFDFFYWVLILITPDQREEG